jgi:hypothetical protein
MEDEVVRWKQAANRTQNSGRAVGGRLFLTDERILFEPHRLDARTGGKPWGAALTAIVRVGTESADGNPFSGGLRTRLRLDLSDGNAEFFVVNHMDSLREVIETGIRKAR